jgi:hypothetical protein
MLTISVVNASTNNNIETKGLSLEQVDKMMEETTPRTSSKWVPHETFASTLAHGEGKVDMASVVEDVERRGSKF